MLEEEDKNHQDAKSLPVYQKAIEIVDLVNRLVEVIEDELANQPKGFEKEAAISVLKDMIANSHLLPVKIAGAHGVDLYDLQMENAALIRKSARELAVNCTGLEMYRIEKYSNYLDVLRDEIELFRVEFAEWIKTFNPWDYIIDRWGLFNPPGVNYDDHDPDDDIPFNPNDDDEF